MCHNPAILYRMTNRGFIREYFADLTLVDLNSQWTVAKKPLVQMWLVTIEGTTFTKVMQTL
jgi:dihydroorotase